MTRILLQTFLYLVVISVVVEHFGIWLCFLVLQSFFLFFFIVLLLCSMSVFGCVFSLCFFFLHAPMCCQIGEGVFFICFYVCICMSFLQFQSVEFSGPP